MRILNSVGLKVKLTMKLEIDNRITVDFTHNYSVGGRTRHMEVKQYFLRELKKADFIICEWCKDEDMSSDIVTKNCSAVLFDKHIQNLWVVTNIWKSVVFVSETGTHNGRVLEFGCECQGTTQWESNERHTDQERVEVSTRGSSGHAIIWSGEHCEDQGVEKKIQNGYDPWSTCAASVLLHRTAQP
jgi:hypothetical protein